MCACLHRYMRRHAHIWWWASNKSLPHPDSSHVSVFRDPQAPLRRGYRHNILATVIQEKFVHFSHSHLRDFDFWATADLHGVHLPLCSFFKALYDSIVGGIWRECWECSGAYSNCLSLSTSVNTHKHTQDAAKVPAVMLDYMSPDAAWSLRLCLLLCTRVCARCRTQPSRTHPDHHIKTIMRRKVNIVLCHAPLTTAESIIIFIFKQLYLINWNRPCTAITIMLLNINLGH